MDGFLKPVRRIIDSEALVVASSGMVVLLDEASTMEFANLAMAI